MRPSPRITQGGLQNGGIRMQLGLYSSLPRHMDSSFIQYQRQLQQHLHSQADHQTQLVHQHVVVPPEYLTLYSKGYHYPVYPLQSTLLPSHYALSQQEVHLPHVAGDTPDLHQTLSQQTLVPSQNVILQEQPGLLMQARHDLIPQWRSEFLLHDPPDIQHMQYPLHDFPDIHHLQTSVQDHTDANKPSRSKNNHPDIQQCKPSLEDSPDVHKQKSGKLYTLQRVSPSNQPDVTDTRGNHQFKTILQNGSPKAKENMEDDHQTADGIVDNPLARSDEDLQKCKGKHKYRHKDDCVKTRQPVSGTTSLGALPQLSSGLEDHLGSGLVVPRRRDTWWGRRISRSLEDLSGDLRDLEDLEHLPTDIQDHILTCQCSCNHLGYGKLVGSSSLTTRTTTCTTDITRKPSTTTYNSNSEGGEPYDHECKHMHKQHSIEGCISGLGNHRAVMLVVALVLATVAGVGVGVPLALGRVDPKASPEQRMEAANLLLKETPFIDGHNDLPWNIRSFMHNKLYSFNFTAELQTLRPWSRSSFSHTDLPRLKEGRVGAQFWVSYVPCASQTLNAVQLTIEQIDLIKRLIDQYSDYLKLATSAEEVEEAFKEGRIASLIGVEGGHAIQNSLGVLRSLRDLGVRYLTLTHTCSTPWAESARARETDPEDPNTPRGLTYYGKVIVKEMNRLGILVDLSHASQATMRAALETTEAPVIFSHSSVYGICRNPRNVPDDILLQMRTNGGIVMVSFYNQFLTCSQKATVQNVIEHINYIRNITGIDHVGIGADFDGINLLPDGLEDVSKYPRLFAELMADPNWSTEDLKKLAGQNLLRVMRQAEKVRQELAEKKTQPYEEEPGPTKLKPYNENCFYKFIKDKDE